MNIKTNSGIYSVFKIEFYIESRFNFNSTEKRLFEPAKAVNSANAVKIYTNEGVLVIGNLSNLDLQNIANELLKGYSDISRFDFQQVLTVAESKFDNGENLSPYFILERGIVNYPLETLTIEDDFEVTLKSLIIKQNPDVFSLEYLDSMKLVDLLDIYRALLENENF